MLHVDVVLVFSAKKIFQFLEFVVQLRGKPRCHNCCFSVEMSLLIPLWSSHLFFHEGSLLVKCLMIAVLHHVV